MNKNSESIEQLSPAYFALVMATGIVSIAASLFGIAWFPHTLLYLNILCYTGLVLAYTVRWFRYRKNVIADLTDHAKSPGYLTFVAATNVLGVQIFVLMKAVAVSAIMLGIGVISWCILIYLFFGLVIAKESKPPIERAISGVWLLTVVSTQSVSVLLTQLAAHLPIPMEISLFLSLMLYLCGCMFYIILITLIMYRLVFFTLTADQFAPPYWINMGAVAITTLSGSLLLLQKESWMFLGEISPFLVGFTLLFWSVGTWWIPLVFFLGLWRHLNQKVPFEYHPQYWGMVFPMGMYTVSTVRLSQAIQYSWLLAVADKFVWIAIVLWAIVFGGMVVSFYRTLRALFRP